MKLAQVRVGAGAAVAICEDRGYRLLESASMNALLAVADASGASLADVAAEAASDGWRDDVDLLLPLEPAEVWACGSTKLV